MKNLEEKLKEFVSTKENPQDYYIEDGLVCCRGYVFITDEDLVNGKLPFRFGEVDGDFICFFCHSLTSLEGCPKKVGGSFICWGCRSLTSLEGSPEKVGGDFDCIKCTSLTSLDWTPDNIGGIIRVSPDMKLNVDID